MTFKDKLNRNSQEDQIEIGQIVEAALMGNFGDLLRCINAGIVAENLENSRRDNTLSSDRVLGRIEALDNLTDRLDRCVDVKNQLTKEKQQAEEVK